MRRILIATDGSEDALRSVEYVANLYGAASDVQVTLLHIYPGAPSIYQEEQHDPLIRKDFMTWKGRREEEAKRYIDEASEVLQGAGLTLEQIIGKYHPKAVGVARDIVWEADKGGYDSIVIGKKGLSKIEELLLGSITNKLLDLSVNHPIWVVDGNINSKKFLIAVDETQQAIRLGRHAGRMLKGLKGIGILLYHCCAPFSEVVLEEDMEEFKVVGKKYVELKRKRITQLFDQVVEVLVDSGIDKRAIETRFHFDPSLPTAYHISQL